MMTRGEGAVEAISATLVWLNNNASCSNDSHLAIVHNILAHNTSAFLIIVGYSMQCTLQSTLQLCEASSCSISLVPDSDCESP